MAKTYLFLADGFEEIEGLTVVDLLRRAGIDITMVSIQGDLKITGSHGIVVQADKLFSEIDPEDADMLILPGGLPGTNHLAEHEGLVKALKQFYKEGKMLAAICAAPGVLGMNHILEGKRATCFPGHEEKLLGAEYTGEKVTVDKNVITGRGMGASMEFGLEIVSHFKGKDAADKLAKSTQFII
ncbi:DJ-1 family glyoxalase III [Anaerolentibacter hominis]|uniref:DJ-1 family glyoxalase III n=1 Tax=Anaerolentibacter hominis TaxID=3079009 RepID=UPI0031B83297